MLHWSDNYIGIPYQQSDCGELAARVQREVFERDIALPKERPANMAGRSRMIDELLETFGCRTSNPQDGDAVLLRAGRLWHIGVFCWIPAGDGRSFKRWLLHTTRTGVYSARMPLRRVGDLHMAVEGYYQWR